MQDSLCRLSKQYSWITAPYHCACQILKTAANVIPMPRTGRAWAEETQLRSVFGVLWLRFAVQSRASRNGISMEIAEREEWTCRNTVTKSPCTSRENTRETAHSLQSSVSLDPGDRQLSRTLSIRILYVWTSKVPAAVRVVFYAQVNCNKYSGPG